MIISAFPGVGKSHAARILGEKACDSDSSSFSWSSPGVRNPDFPDNYIAHIKEESTKREYVFVSTHHEVRAALAESGMTSLTVYPDKGCKEEYIQRFKQRGSPDSFIELLSKNWDAWIDEMMSNDKNICIGSGQYLYDILPDLK
jgi:hypothetical protein